MLFQNALKITDQGKVTYLNSFFRHDYVSHKLSDGTSVFIDGGCILADGGHYSRSNVRLPRNSGGIKIENFSISEDTRLSSVFHRLLWGTRGKKGDEPLHYVPLQHCELGHLRNILANSQGISPLHKFTIGYWINKKEQTK
jgi:hypothetical protein